MKLYLKLFWEILKCAGLITIIVLIIMGFIEVVIK